MARTLNARQLEAFRAVMIAGSITRAGRLLSISQPAVTRLIRDLEADLGMTLFLRQGPILLPTPEGREFYDAVEKHFISTEHLREAAAQIRKHGPARLRIATFPAMANSVLPAAIARFMEVEPETLISVETGASVDIVDHVLSGRADVVVLARPLNRNDLDFFPFPASEAVCILPVAHPLASRATITSRDFDGQDYVALGPSSLMRYELNQLLDAARVKPVTRIECLFSSTAVQFVERGLGVAVVDPLVALTSAPERAVLRRFEPTISYQPSVVFAANAARSAAPHRLSELIVKAYSEVISGIGALLDNVES